MAALGDGEKHRNCVIIGLRPEYPFRTIEIIPTV